MDTKLLMKNTRSTIEEDMLEQMELSDLDLQDDDTMFDIVDSTADHFYINRDLDTQCGQDNWNELIVMYNELMNKL